MKPLFLNDVAFRPRDLVKVGPHQAQVQCIKIYHDCIRYDVAYWDNGEQKAVTAYEHELSLIEEYVSDQEGGA